MHKHPKYAEAGTSEPEAKKAKKEAQDPAKEAQEPDEVEDEGKKKEPGTKGLVEGNFDDDDDDDEDFEGQPSPLHPPRPLYSHACVAEKVCQFDVRSRYSVMHACHREGQCRSAYMFCLRGCLDTCGQAHSGGPAHHFKIQL